MRAEAAAAAALFRRSMAGAGRGDPAADVRDHVDWLVDVSNLRRPEDAAHLRAGLGRAGLPGLVNAGDVARCASVKFP